MAACHRLTALQKARLHLAQREDEDQQHQQQQQIQQQQPFLDLSDQCKPAHQHPVVQQRPSSTSVVSPDQRVAERGASIPLAGKHSAARSHEQNDKYMKDFDNAWEEMQRFNVSGSGGVMRGADGPASSSGCAALPPGPAKAGSGSRPSSSSSNSSSSRVMTAPGLGAFGGVRLGGKRVQGGVHTSSHHPSVVTPGWQIGPINAQGILCDVSDRPTICSAPNWARGEVVVGSSDHALYVIDAMKGTKKRALYSKACGHSEWVTCVTALPDGRFLSGGMDSRLWLWPAGGTRGVELVGHSGAVSQVGYDAVSGTALSSSYDKTVRVWQVGARGREAACLRGHTAPVLELQVSPDGRAASGEKVMVAAKPLWLACDRSGHLIVWDTSAADASWHVRSAHRGHVTALAWLEAQDGTYGSMVVTGGQDGYVRVWDTRSRTTAAEVQLHVNKAGQGAVGNICAGGLAAAGMVVTAGADGTVQILDPRRGFAPQSSIKLTNFPYSMAVAGGLALVGCGDGSLHIVDIREGRTLYALGANVGAVRTIEACEDRLVCSGDDGNVLLYHFA